MGELTELNINHTPQDYELTILLKKLDSFMLETKVFTDPDLTIIKLAEKMEVNPRKIGQGLKLIRNQNFNQYINEFRIYYFLEIINSNPTKSDSFTNISYQVGFNSPNNFFHYFKSLVGCTPNHYLKSLSK